MCGVRKVRIWWCVGRHEVYNRDARQKVGWSARAVRSSGVLFHKLHVTNQRTFHVISQESDFGYVFAELRAYLLVRRLLHLRTRIHGVVVSREQGFDVPNIIRAVSDVGEELELCLHTAGGEDG
jgi:hypothetical protein